jgi:radical SAM protein with 4Fe4S-binding SPASM domain
MISLIEKLKSSIRKNNLLYTELRNLYGIKKGLSGLLKNRRGSLEHIKSTLSLIKKSDKIIGKPINISIEPASICNLKCPVCETGIGDLRRKKAYLTFENFKIIIDKVVSHTNTLMYYFMGEPFVNKEWVRQIKYAKSKGIPFIITCTNGDFANAEDIIESKIDWVSFQLGGITPETHRVYRIDSDFNRVIKNLKDTVALKNKKNAFWLTIEAGFILMKHNEHEVGAFIRLCKKIGLDRYSIIDPCVRTYEQGQEMLPTNKSHWIYDPDAFSQGKLTGKITPQNDCPWIYYSMVITATGDVVPCCRDPRAKYIMGNLITEDFEDIWNNKKYRYFRKMIHNDQKNIGICNLCSGYGTSEIQ